MKTMSEGNKAHSSRVVYVLKWDTIREKIQKLLFKNVKLRKIVKVKLGKSLLMTSRIMTLRSCNMIVKVSRIVSLDDV